MKKIRRSLSILIIAIMTAAPFMSFAAEEAGFNASETCGTAEAGETADLSGMTEDNAVPDELLVLVESGTSKREIESIADEAGAALDSVGTLEDGTKLAKVSLDDPGDAQDIADELLADDSVLIVQPNYVYRLESAAGLETEANEVEIIGEAGSYGVSEKIIGGKIITQWYMESLYDGSARGFDAWKGLKTNGNYVTVAVIDSGAKIDHPDLEKSILKNKCVTFNKGKKGSFTAWDDSYDENGHGTHVAGLIAAASDDYRTSGTIAYDDLGISGMSKDRAKLIVIDAALPKTLNFTTQDTVLAFNYAVEQGADIINLSIGGLYHDYLLEEAINNAYYDKDILTVCSAGNEGSDLTQSPGDSAGAISVRAHDKNGETVYYSNYGYEKDVSAPGHSIISTYTDKSSSGQKTVYSYLSGTSMAAPLVTGLAVLLKSEDPSLDSRELKNLIYTSGCKGSFSAGGSGFGRIDAVSAVNNIGGDDDPDSIVLNRGSAEMYPGEYIDLEYAVQPGSASRHADEVVFSSSDKTVVRVNQKGRITAKAAGTAVITAEIGDVASTCTVTVSSVPVERIRSLPYHTNGYFEPTDQKVKVKYNKQIFEGITDTYEMKPGKDNNRIDITVQCKSAKPFVRVYAPDGKEFGITQSVSKTNGVYIRTASFAPASSGSYMIQIMGSTDGNDEVRKPYSLDIRGSKTVTLPEGTVITKLTGGRGSASAVWKKQSAKTDGRHINAYQIQLATDAKFKKNVRKVTVKGYKNTSAKFSGLMAKKRYYVRIRTYRTVNGKNYCSAWSKAKTVTTK